MLSKIILLRMNRMLEAEAQGKGCIDTNGMERACVGRHL